MEVSPAGSKRWFWKFRLRVGASTVEKRLALGSYPETGAKAARKARDEARKLQTTGADPVQHRRADKLAQAMNAVWKAAREIVAAASHSR